MASHHERYVRIADAAVGIQGKHVLEIGGSTPPEVLRIFRPASWHSVNLNPSAVERFLAEARNTDEPRLTAELQDITTLQIRDRFDIAYSVNCFEHVNGLPRALEAIHRSLRAGGYLFTVFGPIWSSDVGHHLSIPSKFGSINFSDGILQPWEHLTSSADALFERLACKYDAPTAARAIKYIFESSDLNRLTASDYSDLLRASSFSKVLVIPRLSRLRRPSNPTLS